MPNLVAQRADTLLPPGLVGPAKGEVQVLFRWTSASHKTVSTSPSIQHATVLWWGQRSSKSKVLLQEQSSAGLAYTVACGPKAFSRYLKDMQSLKIIYTVQHNKSVTSVEADLNICKLDITNPVTSRTAIAATDGRLLGTAAVSVSIAYSPLVSSFELNEHLVSVDHSMPLYPSSQRITTPLRQLNLQPHSNAPPAAMAAKRPISPVRKPQSPSLRTSMAAAQHSFARSAQVVSLPFEQLLHALNRSVLCKHTMHCWPRCICMRHSKC